MASYGPDHIFIVSVTITVARAEYLSSCEKLPGGTEQDGYLTLRKRDEESREEGEESGGGSGGGVFDMMITTDRS